MPRIEQVSAMEILDSRGRPTVSATCRLTGAALGKASVPSGASTGKAEAIELRDGDESRYGGLGCRRAVGNVNREINAAVAGREFVTQESLDSALTQLDGTPDKSRLGANALLAVSLAFARACAAESQMPLYRHLSEVLGRPLGALPRLTINLFSGGKHAGGQVAIQDVLVVPLSATSIDDSLATTYAVFQSAAKLTEKKYRARPLVADEGGLAPPFPDAATMLADAVESIRNAGYEPGTEVALAVDVAASHFYENGTYRLDGKSLSPTQMIERVREWVQRFPIVSLEDGLAEEDWQHWPALRQAIGNRALVMGDDLLCTNPARIRRATEAGAATALLLKVNQVGTLSEAAEAYRLARSAGWSVTVSARSGETEDNWLADMAVGWSGDFIKIGSITRSERLAKYNRLLEIEHESGLPLASSLSREAGA